MRDQSKRTMRAAACASVTLAVFACVAAADDKSISLPIKIGDQWRYHKGWRPPPDDWASHSFDDGKWLRGPSSFGMGAGEHATTLNDMHGRYTSLFVRCRFYIEDPAAIHALTLEMQFDDGFVAYINGVETARANMTGEPPLHDARAWPSHAIGTPEDYPVSQAALTTLVPGYNVLAIQGHNVRRESKSFTLAPKLAVPNAPPSAATLIAPADGAMRVPSRATLSVLVSDPEEKRMDVSFYGRATGFPVQDGEDFTIVALPDTQFYSASFPEIFVDQTRWIVENRAAMNIAYVAHLGDIVDGWGEVNRYQWENAAAALTLLEGKTPVPYGLAAGNHDGGPSETRLFNEYFGVDRFESKPWYGGHYQENNDNHYDLFTAGGMDFIALYLEYTTQSHGDVLRWADIVLNRYHDRRAIVVSHYLIHFGDPARWSETGRDIYDALKDNPNLFLMLCGHISIEGYRFETFNGNGVHVVLSDYQERANGGDGWLRLYRFSPAQNTISVSTYSPWRNEYERDADSEFVLSYDMRKPAFERVARVRGVESDTGVAVEWPGRSPCETYEWYATATDGTTPTSGALWQFSVDGAGDPLSCDTNCDGAVDALDISPFIELLMGESTRCSPCAGDTNGDGLINGWDIEPFLDCLFP